MSSCERSNRMCGGGLFGAEPLSPKHPIKEPLALVPPSSGAALPDKHKIEEIVSCHLDAELPGRCIKIVDQVMKGVLEMIQKHDEDINRRMGQEIQSRLNNSQQNALLAAPPQVGEQREVATIKKQLQDTITNFTSWHQALGERIIACEKKVSEVSSHNTLSTHLNTDARLNESDAQHSKTDDRLTTCETQSQANLDLIRSLEAKLVAFELGRQTIQTGAFLQTSETEWQKPDPELQKMFANSAEDNEGIQNGIPSPRDNQNGTPSPRDNQNGTPSPQDNQNGTPRSKTQETEESMEEGKARVSRFSNNKSLTAFSEESQIADTNLHYPMRYEFQQSTWDLALFLNLGAMIIPDSVLSALSCTLTVFVQLVFILIVGRSMTEDPLSDDSITELQQWRLFTGHSYEYYDAFSDSSLTGRVCAGSLTLMLSGAQTNLYGNLDSFLGQADTGNWLQKISFLNSLNGTVLCMLCLVLWTLNCEKERAMIGHFCTGVFAKMGKTTELKQAGTEFMLHSVSHGRIGLLFGCSVLPRVIILVFLYIYGSLFLLYTTSLSDLLLNALALTFILEIDDLIFEVFAPFSGKMILNNVEPIQLKVITRDMPAYKFIDVKSLWNFVLLTGIVLIMYFAVLGNFQTHMQQAHTALCDGERNFVTAQSKATSQMYYMMTTPQTGNIEASLSLSQTYAKEATMRMANIWNNYTEADRWSYSLKKTNDFLEEISIANAQTASDLYTCYDQFGIAPDGEKTVITNLLHTMIGGTYSSCESVQPYCRNNNESFGVRTLCPETCLCKDPSALLWDLTGCSGKCQTERRSAASNIIEDLNCEDTNMTYNDTFQNFFVDYEAYLSRNNLLENAFTLLGYSNTTLAEQAWTYGCNLTSDIMSYGVSPDVCTYSNNYGNVNVFCAASCNENCKPPEPSPTPMPGSSGNTTGAQPTPSATPSGPAPGPTNPTPTPSGPAPGPTNPTPTPSGPAPGPSNPTPTPGNSNPTPSPTPTPSPSSPTPPAPGPSSPTPPAPGPSPGPGPR